MDRASALPDRCVVCNAPAEGYRLSRKLYWSPLAWRAGLLALAIVQSYAGAQAVRLKELTKEHAWLARTGAAFRSELPELQ